jgi:CMP/dCMP kinase
MKITIDGPAASGKSTLGAALAQRLGYLYFDTGVMYRAVTLAALQGDIDPRDEAALAQLARAVRIEVTRPHVADGRQYTVRLDGQDVTWDIRRPEVDASVSISSAYVDVRAEMVRQQRRIAEQGNVVMVGRDIGTVVLPDADLKIYLDASVEERARRRTHELQERGQQPVYADVLEAMRKRDLLDTSRAASPLRPAADAIIVDSTGRSADDVLDQMCQLVEARQAKP